MKVTELFETCKGESFDLSLEQLVETALCGQPANASDWHALWACIVQFGQKVFERHKCCIHSRSVHLFAQGSN